MDFGVGRNGFLHISDVEPTYWRHVDPHGGGATGIAATRRSWRPRNAVRGDQDQDHETPRDRDRDRDRAPAGRFRLGERGAGRVHRNRGGRGAGSDRRLSAAQDQSSGSHVGEDFVSGIDLDACQQEQSGGEGEPGGADSLVANPETCEEEDTGKPRAAHAAGPGGGSVRRPTNRPRARPARTPRRLRLRSRSRADGLRGTPRSQGDDHAARRRRPVLPAGEGGAEVGQTAAADHAGFRAGRGAGTAAARGRAGRRGLRGAR